VSAAPRAVPRHGHPDQPYRDRLAMLERTPIHWGGTFLGRAIARPLLPQADSADKRCGGVFYERGCQEKILHLGLAPGGFWGSQPCKLKRHPRGIQIRP
jgi:hypothetical protein